MLDIHFRPATPEDVSEAVPLIHSSGPAAFNYVFCCRSNDEARHFLRKAFSLRSSEWSYANHCVVEYQGRCIGIGAVKEAGQNRRFMFAALRRIFAFYGLARAPGVILRGLRTERVIAPPVPGVGLIYDVAVAPEFRGRGIGRLLVEHLLKKVISSGYGVAALDVADTNHEARELYESIGFRVSRSRKGGSRSAYGELVSHHYMEILLGNE